MPRSSIRILLALFAMILSARTAVAADPPASITKDYDLGNLLVVVPNFDTAPELSAPRDPAKAVNVPTTQPDDHEADELATSVSTWITSLARADESAIRVERTDKRFSVTATSDQHDRIGRQIADVHAQRRMQITVESRFVHLSRNAEAKLPASAADQIDFVRAPGRSTAGVLVDDAIAAAITNAANNGPEESTLIAPRVTLFNGQRAYVLVATQRSLTTGYKKSDNGEWEPTIDAFQNGLLLDVRCRADEAGKIVAINLKPELSRLLDVREEPFKDGPRDQNLKVQVPTMDVRKLDALASMPAGGTMLFHIPAGPDVAADSPRLYVLVKATVLGH